MARAVIMVATRGKSFRRVASTSQTPKIQPQTGEAGNCWAVLNDADITLERESAV